MQEQWSRLSAPAKRLFFHRCQNNLCSVWHNYYGIYRAILAHGFDRTQFDVWWNGVTSREQALILDSLCKLVETANAQVKITGLTDEDHIIVRPALGAESGQLQIF
ncbi:MAG TPA: hypothetical protein VJC05_03835 [Candidatus Andersenbacteria bacterium]|nr:hypothetical protein [Candidatus Andersenbacteria bacterium]